LFEGKNNEAVALAGKHMMGKPKGVKPFQSLGELWFDTPVREALFKSSRIVYKMAILPNLKFSKRPTMNSVRLRD
jgi:hypothetical protein